MYLLLIFAIDRRKVVATGHPEWKRKELFASVLMCDMKGALALACGEHASLEIMMATQAAKTTSEFLQNIQHRDGRNFTQKVVPS